MSHWNPEITRFIDRLVTTGSNYQVEAMKDLYTEDQSILFFAEDGTVSRVSRDEMLSEFSARRESGDLPLSQEYRILAIEEQDNHAVAILYRRMSESFRPFVYELRLKRDAGIWRVSGETVTPWPDRKQLGVFLPPRGA